ncbi:LOW QUALITY PROTEIN: Dimer_Tnp_hAT domain-containing protein, partial [Cephalotus follicularis]
GEVVSGRGLNQEISMKRPGDTRWSSNYDTLINLIVLFSYVCDVLEIIVEDDMQLQELNTRFNEVNTELLLCMACLNPSDSFSAFDKNKLIRFAQFYESGFSQELMVLDDQLETYIIDIHSCNDCFELKGIGDLAKKLVDQKKDIVYPLVYKLMKFALILPVATATVERVFSAMKIVKNRLRNRMGDEWMNDCLVTYIENDIFDTIDNEKIIKRFQNMKTRR